jgi:hypothetical protein
LSFSAATSRRSSVAVDGDDGSLIPVRDASVSSLSIHVLVHSPPIPTPSDSSLTVTVNPSSSSTTKPASSAKPRSTKPAKPARSPSPSPPPQAPIVPLQTIRLLIRAIIRLGGPSNYEVDISRQAKDTGQRAPTPAAVKKVADSSDSDDDEDNNLKDDKPRSKKNKVGLHSFFFGRILL